MDRDTYSLIEQYMMSCMDDSAHDAEHIYRVLYNALCIAETEEGVNTDILITACLLHDVGRKEQFDDPTVCHAAAGARKAYDFLIRQGFDPDFAEQVSNCIRSHRFRKDSQPQSLEAKILFDADKLDSAGAMGIARTLLYQGQLQEPLYTKTADGQICDGTGEGAQSFFHEYKHKLETLYEHFYTQKGTELAQSRKQAAADFYTSLLSEVQSSYKDNNQKLKRLLHY